MARRWHSLPLGFLVFLAFLIFTPAPVPAFEWVEVTPDRLLNAEKDPANWLTYYRTYNGWRYSPLSQINTSNVQRLVPKWILSGGTPGEQQTTPVVNGGIMFTTSTSITANRVYAVNARTGEILWKHERKIPDDPSSWLQWWTWAGLTLRSRNAR